MKKDDYIKVEIRTLKKIFENLPENSRKISELLIENAAFMAVSLRELQSIINEKGYVEEYQNGKEQSGLKKSSEVDVYNTMVKNFNTTMKQLVDLIPDTGGSATNAALAYIMHNGGA